MSGKRNSSCGEYLGLLVVILIVGVVGMVIFHKEKPSKQPVPSTPAQPQNQASAPTPAPTPDLSPISPANTPPQPQPNAASLATFVRAVHDNYGLLRTNDGKVFVNVQVNKVDPSGINFICDAGVATIPFERFSDGPPDIKKIYGFDPALAATYRKAQADFVANKPGDAPSQPIAPIAHDNVVKPAAADTKSQQIHGTVQQIISVDSAHTQGYLVRVSSDSSNSLVSLFGSQTVLLIGVKPPLAVGDTFPSSADGNATVYYAGTTQYATPSGESRMVKIYTPDRASAAGAAAASP